MTHDDTTTNDTMMTDDMTTNDTTPNDKMTEDSTQNDTTDDTMKNRGRDTDGPDAGGRTMTMTKTDDGPRTADDRRYDGCRTTNAGRAQDSKSWKRASTKISSRRTTKNPYGGFRVLLGLVSSKNSTPPN